MLTAAEREALVAENAAWIARQPVRVKMPGPAGTWPRRKGCLKRGFESAEKAREDAAGAPFRIRVYRCDDRECGRYHVTNADKRT